jgi:predicted DCC family thiol-disulfide oxidoreductase YuxK
MWTLAYLFLIVPRSFRDFIYGRVANNRYKLFGKREVCRIPTAEERDKFID